MTTGRHDPCVGLRATPIAEAMIAIVVMDHFLRHRGQNADVETDTPKINLIRAITVACRINMKEKFNIAVVGATGLVGGTMIEILEQRGFPVDKLYPLASERSAGTRVEFSGRQLSVKGSGHVRFQSRLISRCSRPAAAFRPSMRPRAGEAGCIVIDNTSYFRNEPDIPLVVPEVNPEAIAGYPSRNIIANPNCSTIQMVVALKPLHDAVGIERINVATYQAVSGAGRGLVAELAGQTAACLNGRPKDMEGDAKPIAFNAIPHIDDFQDNGYTREEMKMVWETRKILR